LTTTLALYHLKRILLEPARSKGEPETGQRSSYEFIAPLDETGHISVDGWKKERARCFVHRMEGGHIVERGVLVHKPGGAGGSTWAFDYAEAGGIDEEAGYRFGAHAFVPGEYVSIRDEDGSLQTLKVEKVGAA
jgi:hypothetical protein